MQGKTRKPPVRSAKKRRGAAGHDEGEASAGLAFGPSRLPCGASGISLDPFKKTVRGSLPLPPAFANQAAIRERPGSPAAPCWGVAKR